MDEKLISKAIECYIEKLEKDNVLLHDILRKISNTFGSNMKGRTERELLDEISNFIMYYDMVFKEENK